jgi:Ca-activated chloride channel family protein
VRLDEESLKAVAQMTRGEYFHAATGADLKKVYEELNSRFVLERRETEVTSLFSIAALLLGALAVLLSLRWFGRTA